MGSLYAEYSNEGTDILYSIGSIAQPLYLCLSTVLFVSSENMLWLPTCPRTSCCASITPAFIIYSQIWVLFPLQEVWFSWSRLATAQCLHPVSSSWRQGPAELMIRHIYGPKCKPFAPSESEQSKARFPNGTGTDIHFVLSDCTTPPGYFLCSFTFILYILTFECAAA